MFNYTRASIGIILDDIKRYHRAFKFGSLIFTLAYFSYALAASVGHIAANIFLVSLYLSYFVFEIVTRDTDLKKTRRAIRRSYRVTRITVNAVSLAIMLYGIYTATTSIEPISIILATLMIISWVLQLLLAITVEIVESKVDLLVAGWNKDMEDLKPKNIIGNVFKWGKDQAEDEKPKSREMQILEERVRRDKEARREKKRRRKSQIDDSQIEYEM